MGDRRSKAMFKACLADNVMNSLNVYVSHFSCIVEISREALHYVLSTLFFKNSQFIFIVGYAHSHTGALPLDAPACALTRGVG